MWIVRRVLVTIPMICVAVAFVGAPILVDPWQVDPGTPDDADAIIALGGIERTASEGYRLAETGAAPVLIIADPYEDPAAGVVTRLCRSRPVSFELSCFDPEPGTTRGEAREIARLADEHGWDRVIVVAPVYQVTRAEWIISRCYDGELVMTDTDQRFDALTWTYQYAYQSVAFVKAMAFQYGC